MPLGDFKFHPLLVNLGQHCNRDSFTQYDQLSIVLQINIYNLHKVVSAYSCAEC
jgi:hypothetical protein